MAGWRTRPHTPPIKSGKTIVFFTLEDETDLLDVTVFPNEYEVYGRAIFAEPLVVVVGQVQRRDGAFCLIAESVRPLRGVVAPVREMEDALPPFSGVMEEAAGWEMLV